MELSDTPRGRRWLSNFHVSEEASARLLLNSIELVGQDDLRAGLTDVIARLSMTAPTPIALVPARELAKGQAYFPPGRDSQPRMLLSSSFPGSEAIVANILTGVRRAGENSGPYVAAPSLKNMRKALCRTILIVDDFSGSGDRIVRFFEGVKRHRTVRSWLSYGKVEFRVAVYAATQVALRRLARVFSPDRVHVHTICPTFASREWGEDERDRVVALCRKYKSSAIEAPALGYGETGGLMAMSHSAPNNLPVVLWQMHRAGSPGWEPFFCDKAVPADIQSYFGMTDEERRRQSALKRLGQTRLAGTDWEQLDAVETQNMLLTLAALARRRRERTAVAELTGLTLVQVNDAINACLSFQLIDRSLHLTDSGLAELRHAKSVRLPQDEWTLQGSDEPYYPRSLRVGC